ncbi:hypothetical protein PACILC2_17200 [Paenibacillus cisolokensis]|uniref:YdhG-like domain-containing protein n=1 Tax=Paenibacillus cisolokensis TaxID=1658519 RepID=A0ABQ4N4R5_9BACL|nr:DUF1801 domain-containing protein [Paenibacillus cisolokensis]GIQ63152.1 hypothetical protein PACILC2_17200 [Paenibacillus cisolokensis]
MASTPKKPKKLTGHEQVVAYLDNLESPLKHVVEEIRTIILNADGRLTEHIKWNAPSFCLHGDDRITFNLHGKGAVRLVFHRGAKVKGQPAQERLFEDATGLLDWVANDRATVVFQDMNDVEQKREKLKKAVVKWLEVTSPE